MLDAKILSPSAGTPLQFDVAAAAATKVVKANDTNAIDEIM